MQSYCWRHQSINHLHNTHNVVTNYFSLGWDIMALNVLLMSEELVSVGLVNATK